MPRRRRQRRHNCLLILRDPATSQVVGEHWIPLLAGLRRARMGDAVAISTGPVHLEGRRLDPDRFCSAPSEMLSTGRCHSTGLVVFATAFGEETHGGVLVPEDSPLFRDQVISQRRIPRSGSAISPSIPDRSAAEADASRSIGELQDQHRMGRQPSDVLI